MTNIIKLFAFHFLFTTKYSPKKIYYFHTPCKTLQIKAAGSITTFAQ